MHLLFDSATYAWLGEVRESNGVMKGVDFTSAGRKRLSSLWRVWEREGIEVLKSLTRVQDEERQTVFVHERVPLHSAEAFRALVATAPQHGWFVCSLDAKRVGYWNHLVRWPISDAMKFELIFAAKNLPVAELPEWDKEWNSLRVQMAAV